jgi:hypothetical protein
VSEQQQQPTVDEYPISSPEIDKLAPAMCKAQNEIKRARKDSENPFFKSQYADLASVMDACQEALNKHGFFYTQPVTKNRAGDSVLVTRLYHESGQWLQSVISLGAGQSNERSDEPKIPGTEKKSSNPVQKTVAEITYLRRACLSALVGVAADDDDGNEAEGQGQPTRPAAPRQTAPVVPTKPGGAPNISR